MKVFIVDDSILIRNIVKEILAADPEAKLAGEASNGADGVAQVLALKPDIVLMDFDMPVMNGLDATARIAEMSRIPVVIFTRNTDSDLPFKALARGAADFILKPGFAELNDPAYVTEFLSRLKALARKPRLRTLPGSDGGRPATRSALRQGDGAPLGGQAQARSSHARPEVVVIGASTGGPQALASLLSGLGRPFPLPLCIVQHIETGFDRGFAEWLGEETGHRVLLAENGMKPVSGLVYIAPSDSHLRLTAGGLALDQGPKVLNQRPSVDVLFRSAAELHGERVLAVLLTGMGTDGAEGCAAVKARSGTTVVQDEESALIFGMPKAAIERGAASVVLPLSRIAAFLEGAVEVRP